MNLSKEETLRYLGYKGTPIPQNLDKMIDRCLTLAAQTAEPKSVYARYNLQKTPQGLILEGTDVCLTGADVAAHLQNCKEVYLLAVTVGLKADRLIRMKMTSAPDEGVIFNSAFGVAIEAVADAVEDEIRAKCAQRGLNTTWRYSPGYGDLPLDSQRDILTALGAPYKIGLSVTDTMILTPTKSVTAIIGVTDTAADKRQNKCDYCGNRDKCVFRKSGKQC